MSVAVLGIGIVSALGCGLDDVRSGMEGKRKPAISHQHIQTSQGNVDLPYYQAQISGLEKFVQPTSLRRMTRFSQMALLAAHLAVKDSGINLKGTTRAGIVFGSAYGPLQAGFSFLDSLIDGSDSCPSPTSFATSVHNSMASLVSISLQIHGPSLTLSAFDLTCSSVLEIAELWLQTGELDYVLAGLGEEYCDVRGYATALLTKTEGSIEPFRLETCTYVPGEGFVCLLLGKQNNGSNHLACESGKGKPSFVSSSQIVFIAANGDKKTGKHYEPLLSGDRQVRCFSPLYGSMPVGVAFELAAAAVCLRDSLLYKNPVEMGNNIDSSQDIPWDAEITCIQYDEKGRYLALKLKGTR
jgi:hypothetical protein